jgi:hypothetical protein
MDILKKMPQDIENKIFYMIAEHPVARAFKEGVRIEKGTFMGDHLLFFGAILTNGLRIHF